MTGDSSVPKDLSGSMHSMMQDMQGMPMSGDVDQDFAMMMMRHHQGAIDMAQVELRDGKNPEMRRTAEKTIRDQSAEMEELKQFLSRHRDSTSKASGES